MLDHIYRLIKKLVCKNTYQDKKISSSVCVYIWETVGLYKGSWCWGWKQDPRCINGRKTSNFYFPNVWFFKVIIHIKNDSALSRQGHTYTRLPKSHFPTFSNAEVCFNSCATPKLPTLSPMQTACSAYYPAVVCPKLELRNFQVTFSPSKAVPQKVPGHRPLLLLLQFKARTTGSKEPNLFFSDLPLQFALSLFPECCPHVLVQLPPATKAPRGRPSPRRRAEENGKKEAETGGSG